MLSMLQADLHRILRRKGNFYGYMIAYLIIVLVISIGIPLLTNAFNGLSGQLGSDVQMDATALYTSPLNFLSGSLLIFGIVSIFASWCVASYCWSDMRAGYNRSIVSCVGKKTYYTEKLVFALVMSFIFVLAGSVVGTLAAAVTMGFSGIGSIPSLLLWWMLLSVVCWGNAALAVTVLWLTRSNVLAVLLALTLGGGIVSSIIGLMVSGIPVVGEAWDKITAWLPCEALSRLSSCVSNDALALTVGSAAHILLPTLVCLAISFACTLTVLRKRDL